MTAQIIHDRGRGPEITGTRITVYNLLPHFLDPEATEAEIGRLYDLDPEQVAAARAYVLNHPEAVLGTHLQIEARMEAGNSPEVIERAKETHATFLKFKEWLAERERTLSRESASEPDEETEHVIPRRPPTFKQWRAEQES